MGKRRTNNLCNDCGIQERKEGYSSLCRECHNKRSKKYHKEIYRWSKYGLSGPIPMERCEICGDTKSLVIDHCHELNKFRGVLCRQCNSAIGLFKESLQNIGEAANYLRKFYGPISKDFE